LCLPVDLAHSTQQPGYQALTFSFAGAELPKWQTSRPAPIDAGHSRPVKQAQGQTLNGIGRRATNVLSVMLTVIL